MASVAWTYPHDELIALKARSNQAARVAASQVASGLDPTRLEFGYRTKGDKPAWRPVQVFDDGAKTYVLLPADVSTRELQQLFLIGERKRAELVNYRYPARYRLVD